MKYIVSPNICNISDFFAGRSQIMMYVTFTLYMPEGYLFFNVCLI